MALPGQVAATPRVSIALATYNGGRFIREQLNSLARQTVLPTELVVSDDGSTDDTLDTVAQFATEAAFPVRILPHHPRLGFADNFLHAAEHCRSEVVAFADQDDVWRADKLERGIARLIGDDSLLSLHWLTVTDNALQPIGINRQGIDGDQVCAPLTLQPHNSVWGNTMMFRRELVTLIPRERRPKQPGADRLLSHDHWVHVLAASLGRVSHVAEPLILYRQHRDNVFGVTDTTLAQRLQLLCANPVDDLRDRAAFAQRLSSLFAELGQRDSPIEAAQARRAAARFADRERRLALRLAAYALPSAGERLRACLTQFRDARTGEGGLAAGYRAAMKDLVLGAAGLSGFFLRGARDCRD